MNLLFYFGTVSYRTPLTMSIRPIFSSFQKHFTSSRVYTHRVSHRFMQKVQRSSEEISSTLVFRQFSLSSAALELFDKLCIASDILLHHLRQTGVTIHKS